jgi:hypothetical protein
MRVSTPVIAAVAALALAAGARAASANDKLIVGKAFPTSLSRSMSPSRPGSWRKPDST